MELAQPFFLLLLPVVAGWLWLALHRGNQDESSSWLLRHPQLGGDSATPSPVSRVPVMLMALAFALMVIALAQPREIGNWITPPPEGRDIALVIDTSLTMSINDFEQRGQKIERLAMLKSVMSQFIRARQSDRFAILAFGGVAATLTPPTFDHQHAIAQLGRLQVGMAGDNTALGDALGLALKQLESRKLRPAVILVSDGAASNAGDMTPSEAVAVARQLGVAVHTVQVGSDLFAAGRAPVIEENPQPDLAEISRLTGGHHWFVRDTQAAEQMLRDVDALEKTLARPAQHREVREWVWLPLALAALCLAIAQILIIRRQG